MKNKSNYYLLEYEGFLFLRNQKFKLCANCAFVNPIESIILIQTFYDLISEI